MRLPLVLLSASLLLLSPVARAMFAMPQLAPVDRLIQSATGFLKEHPQEAEAHYTLGRVHYLAFSAKKDQILSYRGQEGEKVNLPDRSMMKMFSRSHDPSAPKTVELPPAEVLAHAVAAQKHMREAITLEPKNPLYVLGEASLLEEVRAWVATAKPTDVPLAMGKITLGQLRAAYAKVFDLAIKKDEQIKSQPLQGMDGITSYEAARSLERLAKEDESSLTEAERKKLEEGKAAIAKFQAVPMLAVTPIVLSMTPAPHLDDMLDRKTIVDFDLRGYGPAERWPWVKPELGFLMWDPRGEGRIDSARKLFGSYTHEIFRRTGYDALAALDDNRDGQLTGPELEGIRVWFDRNSDGVSTASEVVSLEQLGITAIATTAPAQDGVHPMNPTGVTLRNGRTWPTWDWMVEPTR